MRGLVLRSTGSFYRLKTPEGIIEARLGGRLRLLGHRHTNPVAVGDHVLVQNDDQNGEWLITEVESRKNYLIRKSTKLSKETQIIASNIDVLIIVASISQPRTSTGFLDRLLVSAEAYDIPALLLVNKVDLLKKEREHLVLEEWKTTYAKAGYPLYSISAYRSEDIEKVRGLIKDKVCLFSGHSGAGKSTLINALAPHLALRTGGISSKHNKGKHTTTFAEMFFLDDSTAIIDTPGIKEFGLYDMAAAQISHFFPEIFRAGKGCKFQNCLHTHEPDCAAIRAVEAGEIAESRYLNYVQMLETNQSNYKR